MQHILFTKMIRELGIEATIEAIHKIGADGVDLAVRPGYPVNPANVRTALPKAAAGVGAAGLTIPLITLPTDMTDPNSRTAVDAFAACHDAGILNAKLGYWTWKPGDYRKQVDAARKDLDGWQRLAERFGVRACLHTHSGDNLGLNASAAMELSRGFNPLSIGVYLDAGHLALCGEPIGMAVSIAGDHLALVAVKDMLWVKTTPNALRKTEVRPFGDGFVDWSGLIAALKAANYAGALSFHSEYERMTTARLLDQTRKDIAYLRAIEAGDRRSV